MSDARLRLRTLSSPEEILPLVAEVDGQSFSYLQFVMVFLKFAVVDPDVVRPSTAESGASFFRVEDSFQRGQTIHAIFLEACESVFLHLTISKERGLQSTIFCGRDRDSGSNISLAVQDPNIQWDEMVAEFLPLFNVTFQLHSKHVYEVRNQSPLAIRAFSVFDSISDRQIARLAKEDSERGDFLPYLRVDWCQLWKSRTFPSEPFVHIQWKSVIGYLFEAENIRFTESVVSNKDHHIYQFIGNFCVLLKNLNKRWSKTLAIDATFSKCPVLSRFFPNSGRPYSDRDEENHLDNKG